MSGSTGTQPSTVIPESSTTCGARWTGTARKRSNGSSPPSRRIARAAARVELAHLPARVPRDPALGECALQGRRRLGRRRDRPPEVDHQRDLRAIAQPAPDQLVVQHQRCLARRRRALVRRRQHADDHASALEAVEHLTRCERALDAVELVPGLGETGSRRWIEVGAERDHHDVALELPRVGLHAPRLWVDRPDRRLHEPHPRLDELRGTGGGRPRAPSARTSRRASRSRTRRRRSGRRA